MRRTVLMLIMMVALSMVVFAPVAVAQDDNPSSSAAEDRGGAEDRGMDDRGFDDNGGSGGVRTFDDNPTGADDATATAKATAKLSGKRCFPCFRPGPYT
jgi:hypothetical protein